MHYAHHSHDPHNSHNLHTIDTQSTHYSMYYSLPNVFFTTLHSTTLTTHIHLQYHHILKISEKIKLKKDPTAPSSSTSLMSVSPQGQGVVNHPVVVLTLLGVGVQMTLLDTSVLLSDGSKTSGLSVLVDRVADPVVSWVSSDGLVEWIDTDDLKVLVDGILIDPVRVEDSQVADSSSDSLFGGSSHWLLVLQVVHTLSGWLTVCVTSVHWSLSVTSLDTHSVDNETLLGLVSQLSGSLWSGWSGSSVNDILLSVFPASDTRQESHDIRLLLSVQLGNVLVGTHFGIILVIVY